MNMSKIKGNKLCTVDEGRYYDLICLEKIARFLTLHDYKENEFLFSWESTFLSISANIIEVPNAHKPWLS